MLLLALLSCGHTIAALDPPPTLVAPPTAGDGLRVCPVEYATGTLPHGMVVAHRALREDVESTQSGLLLLHPDGTWLVDGGSVADVKAELKELHGLPRLFIGQAAKGWTMVARPADAVRAAGGDPGALAGLIPTHAHFDHLGGLLELDAPLWLPQAELDLAAEAAAGRDASVMPAEARAVGERGRALTFDGGPVYFWDQSRDLFGDGSVVLVPLPGHTPGSLGVLARTATGRELFLVGDTVWVREGYEQREPKGWLASSFDADGDANDLQIARIAALHQARPDIAILPAHDRRVWRETFAGGCL